MPPPRLPPSHSAPRIRLSKKKQKKPKAGGISSTPSAKSSKKNNSNINNNSPAGRKLNEINDILSQPEIDLWALRELCLTEGGLINGKFLPLFYAASLIVLS
jgi:hypothetical protein